MADATPDVRWLSGVDSMVDRVSTIGQFAWISGGRAIGAAIQATTLIIVAREVAPSDFGVLGIVLGLTAVVQVTLDMGVSTYIVKERAADRSSPTVGSALGLSAPLGIAIGTVMAGIVATLAWSDHAYWALLPLAFWAALDRYADLLLGVPLADGDAWHNSANIVLRRGVCLGTLLVLIMCGLSGLAAFAFASALGAAAGALLARWSISTHREVISGVSSRSVLRAARPYWWNSLATQFRNVDALLVSSVAGTVQAGFYSVASRITVPLRILPTSMATAILPAATRGGAAGRREVGRLLVATLGVMTVVYVGLALSMPTALPLVLGDDYSGSVPAVQAVLFGLPFAACASIVGSSLQGMGRQRRVAAIAVATTAVGLPSIALGAAIGGALGAAIGLGFSYVLQSVLLGIVATREIPPGDVQS